MALHRILIIKWSAIGDLAIASALMADIRSAYPAAELHLNTLPAGRRLFAHDRRFAKLIIVDVRDRRRRLRANIEWLRCVRMEEYDAIIDLQNCDHTRILLSALVLTGCKAQLRLGARGGFPYTNPRRRVAGVCSSHTTMSAVLESSGVRVTRSLPSLAVPETDILDAQMLTAVHTLDRDRFAVLLPGSQAGGTLKRWGAANYTALGLMLLSRGLTRVAVIGGMDERDECRTIVEAINKSVPNGAVALMLLPLLQIPIVCEGAYCVVANDTGTAHVAAMADRRMVVVFGPTDPRRAKPLGSNVTAVQADLPCVGCYEKRCIRYDRPLCMEIVTPDIVMHAIERNESRIGGVNLF